MNPNETFFNVQHADVSSESAIVRARIAQINWSDATRAQVVEHATELVNAVRHSQSPREAGAKTPARMPVAPMIRPMTSIKSTADSPIRLPPNSDCSGVNVVSKAVSCQIFCAQ